MVQMVQNFVPFLSARKILYHTILYHISEGGGGGGGEKRGVGRQQPGAAKPRFAPEGNAGRMARPSLVSVCWNYNADIFSEFGVRHRDYVDGSSEGCTELHRNDLRIKQRP